jgi:hypothetical protein
MRYTPFVAAMALAVLGACGGNKDNAGGQPGASSTADTSAGAMSSPSANPSATTPSATPAPGTPTTPDSSAMQPDTNMKKMSGRKHHKASSDTTTH